nr:SIR2 family protein [Deinococcus betulae]
MEEIGRLKVQSIVTTNYGRALMERFSGQGFEISLSRHAYGDYIDRATPKKHRIYHIHGYIDEGQRADQLDIALASSEYERYYNEDTNLEHFLRDIFAHETIIFIGLGFSRDDPFPKILEALVQTQRTNTMAPALEQQHLFAFMNLPCIYEGTKAILDFEALNNAEDDFQKMGVVPIWFDPGNSFKQLKSMISALANADKGVQSINEQGGEPPLTRSEQ